MDSFFCYRCQLCQTLVTHHHFSLLSLVVHPEYIDFGRTPFHDACWRTEPDLDILDLLLDNAPELLMLSDKRGHTPLDYSRRQHWGMLVPFLEGRKGKFRPARDEKGSGDGGACT